MRLTAIPADRFVSVDGVGLHFDFEAPEGVEAVQWYGEQGTLQRQGGADPITDAAEVQPYLDAWLAEKARLDAIPPPPPSPPFRRLVAKGLIVERIIEAGKIAAADAALAALPLEDRKRWENKTAIYADDDRARTLLRGIGLDPDAVLAP